MRKKITFITGANGEMGQGLIKLLHSRGVKNILAFDLNPISDDIKGLVAYDIAGDILNNNLLDKINIEYEIESIYHLAALLSTQSEFSPVLAHQVNVNGTLNILSLAIRQAKTNGKSIKVFYPSSIAVYSVKSNNMSSISENENCNPITMYGCNKLYCENLGIYFAKNFNKLSEDYKPNLIDFRCIRFPGLISAYTIPTGGTSDYLPEMLHSAIKKQPYKCFVERNTKMPFMVMPDAISAICNLMNTDITNLSANVYNVTAFNPSPNKFYKYLKQYIPSFQITYDINSKRQEMVDSWPSNVDDSRASNDWGWQPEFNLKKAFKEYLIPSLNTYYDTKD
tara:strand:- start:345 stop:1358 length:1014 start_codon:yes stop_codon:yes gene_type:complete